MRFTIIFTFFAFVFTLVGATPGGLNARRMAQGLPPLPPVRRSPTRAAHVARSQVSSTSQCGTGSLLCCNPLVRADSPGAIVALSVAGVTGVPGSTIVGTTCSTLNGSTSSCSRQPACCQNKSGTIGIGCTSVSIPARR